ncbi:MAG TPA: hypothetical protein VFE33_19220 [Thermoanaerobaculia bacterium]|nr:hypothetical protein [Thermoanaerobaculia bacterium]
MFHNNRAHRLLPALVLTALVAGLASPAHARPAAQRGGDLQREGDLFSSLWTAVSRLWEGHPGGGSAGRDLRRLAGAEGATLDPHGGSTTGGTGGTAATPGSQGSGSH